MAVSRGRSIELFFHDGEPDGMVSATIPFQWTGHVLVTGRTQLSDALRESETAQPGVYLLIGEDDQGESTLYVGETDEIRSRIRQHAKSEDKNWWDIAVFVTATGEPLNKAHARYLEHRIHSLAQAAGKVKLANSKSPTASPLSKAALAHMDDFLNNLQLVLPALRLDFLLQQTAVDHPPHDEKENTPPIYFIMEVPRHGVKARARLEQSTGKFIVEAGSLARKEWVGSTTAQSTYARLHAELVEQGILQPQDGHLIYVRSYAFKSTSAAAAVTAGRPATGPGTWILEGSTKTYGEWESEDLERAEFVGVE